MNELSKRLFRKLCSDIDKVLIGQTTDTKQPVITFIDKNGNHFASLWLQKSTIDDTATIRAVEPY